MAATSEDTIALLRAVPVFSELGEEELARVAEVAVPRQFVAGEVVFREGDESNTCYVVRYGRRAPCASIPTAVRSRSPTSVPATSSASWRCSTTSGSATIETLEDTEAVAILGGDMRRLLGEHSDIAVKLLASLGRRLRETNERLARQSFQTVQSRVASVLLQLVAGARSEGDEEGDVLITSTQASLAQLAGSSRESASRFLAVLERAGIITQGRGKLVVHDPGALERYVY